MKKAVVVLLAILVLLLAACGRKGSDEPESNLAEEVEMEMSDCYVSFEDGDSYDYPVAAYGEAFALPESSNTDAAGDFYGWIGVDGFYQPGDMVVAEEFMSFTALRSDPDCGTAATIDPNRNSYNILRSEEEMELPSPYDDYDYSDSEDYFVCWVDEEGNTYEGGAPITLEKGDVLLLTSSYSEDHSGAYKVDIYYNTGDDLFNMEFHRYVKKGESIPLWLLVELNDKTFDGWYDAPEGGSLMGNTDDLFTPTSDIVTVKPTNALRQRSASIK